jgi:hypothetical protein
MNANVTVKVAMTARSNIPTDARPSRLSAA